MAARVIFFESVLKEKLWGSESWTFSAHPNGQSIVKNGALKGMSLGELWETNRKLFGNIEGEKFPILVKIIDAKEDLSVQVHPGDEYAKKHEDGELGKTECWYILDCDKNAEMVYGINAKSKEELYYMIDKGQWSKLLRKVPIKKGDFFYVPSGTVHALCAGTIVLEVQQNSNTTYRLYDYDRKDEHGNLRELHMEKSKDVIQAPFQNIQPAPKVQDIDGMTRIQFINSPYFTVEKYEVREKVYLANEHPFMLMSVIEGEGILRIEDEKYPIIKGDHFMLSSEVAKFSLEGSISIIASYI